MTKPVQTVLNFRPMKPREADSPKAVIADLYNQIGGVKEVMFRFDIGKSQAYAYTDEQSAEQISFARVVSLTTPASPAAAEFLASRAGGVFCALPQTSGGCPMSMTADAMREHGEGVAAALEAMTGKPTPAGRAKVRKELEESICALAALLGHFREDGQ